MQAGPWATLKEVYRPPTASLYPLANFIIDAEKVRQWVIPDLRDCPLKPYVSHTTDKTLAAIEAVKTVQDYIDRSKD